MKQLKSALIYNRDMTFLLFDDNCPAFFIARRTAEEVKPEFHDMEPGETRMLTEKIGITREK